MRFDDSMKISRAAAEAARFSPCRRVCTLKIQSAMQITTTKRQDDKIIQLQSLLIIWRGVASIVSASPAGRLVSLRHTGSIVETRRGAAHTLLLPPAIWDHINICTHTFWLLNTETKQVIC